MATLVLTTVGALVGGPIGGALGAVLGQAADQALFAPKARHGPRLGDLAVQTSSYGSAIPKIFGTMRVAGTVIWSTDLIERRAAAGGGKGRPKSVDYSYSASFAVALSGRPVREVRRIWADGKLLRGAAGDWKAKTGFRLHGGDDDQPPDPLIASAEGVEATAFRGLAYVVFEELELADFGNRIPSLSFEVEADPGTVSISSIAETLGGGLLVAGAAPTLAGFAASGDSVRGAIEELVDLVALSVTEDGGRLVLGAVSGPAVAISRGDEAGRRELVRRPAASLPREVSVTYYDAARDYQAGLQRAFAGDGCEARAEQRAVPAVLEAGAAKALAEQRLNALWTGRASATVTLGWARAGLRPGMLVRLEGEGGTWRVERATLGAMTVRLELVRMAAGAAAPFLPASPGRALPQPDQPAGTTVLRVHDLPLSGTEADRPVVAVLAAGTATGWRRAALSVSFDKGASWSDIGGTAAPAVLGTTMNALPSGAASLFDHVASVDVELLHDEMELLSRNDDALVAGANLALIGNELVQFGRAERLGPAHYRLSRMLRGRRGTEWAAGGHAAGDDFALIEQDSLRLIDLSTGAGAGGEMQLQAIGLGDQAPAEAALVLTGEAMRPPSPVNLTAAASSGGTALAWTRRSRLGWFWTSGADTPLGEERELYRVSFSGSAGARTTEVSAPHCFYSAAERAADGGGPVRIEVVQLGTWGASRPAVIDIP